ncbi:Adhesion G-protein coupled receptor G4 [Pseudolycoriella hygida]|uniref:Adhesion G-protein coupled receptor G4 n=1 Tax=Pseudolycoriella hygida TaxID=35572 RepID=A0A9Q0N031_9DIPT|nr:Adhesion G-protein coupled receptor G4 [Pseudolycoriella hygida]
MKRLFKVFLVYLLYETVSSQSGSGSNLSLFCPNEVSLDDNGTAALWPVTDRNRRIITDSSPQCLDDQKYLLTRECTTGGWIPEVPPNCSYTQPKYDLSNKCPLGYESVQWKNKILCILVTTPQSWNNTCLVSGSVKTLYDFDSDERESIFVYLRDLRVSKVWMPAKRLWSYGPVIWTLPGKTFGETVEFNDLSIRLSEEEFEDGCFSLNVENRGRIGAVENCTNNYPILCVMREDSMVRLACPDDFHTTRYEGHQEYCFSTYLIPQGSIGAASLQRAPDDPSLSWVISECRGELFTMNSVEKTKIFEHMGKYAELRESDRCLFGVMQNLYVDSPESWTEMFSLVDYVNWAYPRENGTVITADRHGKWHWTSTTLTCIACQRRVELHLPQIVLTFLESKERLYAVVYEQKYLWRENDDDPGIKCFTNSDYELVRTVSVEDEVWSGLLSITEDGMDISNSKKKTIYELKTYGDGPGYYWCEGHAIPNFQHIRSDAVVAYKRVKGEIFAVLVELTCRDCGEYFQEKRIKELAKRFREYLENLQKNFKHQYNVFDVSIENVRAMRINSINKVSGTAKIVFHVTISLDDFDDDEEDLLDMSLEMLKIYKIRNYLHDLMKSSTSLEYRYLSLNSTEYCLPDSISTINELSWINAKIGETAAPRELCLLPSGLPVHRSCVGNFIDGGVWVNSSKQQCYTNGTDITQALYDIDQTFKHANDTSQTIATVTQLLTNNHTSLIPADLFYLSKIMQTITKFSNESFLNQNESKNIFTIYNNLMFVNENITKMSAALNSTNILLDAFDGILCHLPTAGNQMNRINLTENLNDGTIAVVSPKLIMYAIDPMVRNFSGIALYRTAGNISLDGQIDDFTNPRYYIRLLPTNQSTTLLLEDEELEVASFVPQSLLNRLNETRRLGNETNSTNADVIPKVNIVITIYFNDLLFQEYKNTTHAKSGGKIISVSIPGYGPMLPELLPIFIKTNNLTGNTTADVCGYWDLKNNAGWARDGCEYGGSSGYFDPVVLCACSHLTHFAYLILGTYVHSISYEDNVIITDLHQEALDMITLLGCSLSLIGILGITITAIVFPRWREKPSSKVLLQLSAAIALQMILLCFVNTEVSLLNFHTHDKWYECVALGAALQYSVLVAFSWMLITAYLQFMRYVRVLGYIRSSRFFLKSFLIGWGVPLIPVLLVVFISPNSYIPNLDELITGICYPTGYALYFGVIVPIGLIITANLVIFILVIYNIVRGPDGKLRTNERDITLAQLRLSIFLFFLLGLSWIFGFCATTRAGLVFSYLFCLTATLQGFVLFLYFVILDSVTRSLWTKFLKKYFCCLGKTTK